MTAASESITPRVGFFGLLGQGNFGNDGSMESVLNFLRKKHPDVILGCLCSGPENVAAQYGIPATRLNWYRSEYQTASSIGSIAMKALGKSVDAFRTLAWVRRFDVVIVPGMGVLDSSLPLRPWGFPYSLFLLCAAGRLCGTRIALVSVGAEFIQARSVRWLIMLAARLACYRSYRDIPSRDAMRRMGVNTVGDEVYSDLAFALPRPPETANHVGTVGVGVMKYRGSTDDRRWADEIYRTYVDNLKQFVRWLVDNDRRVRLLIGDDEDAAVIAEILSDLRDHQPDLGPSWVVTEPVRCLADVMHQMSLVDTVVATRFHNVVCALRMSKPVVAIGYGAKNEGVMTQMGLAEFCQRVKSLDVKRLVDQYITLESRRDEIRCMLTEKNLAAAKRLEHQFTALSSLIDGAANRRPSRVQERA
jgi:polysaccharide pyruvyl transferase WcaK-like protein